jgi:nucleoside-diphosphate-sugar epimerase
VKAFVTGGTGFVGAHLVQALRTRGDQVTCLVRSPKRARALGWSEDITLVTGDLHDRAALAAGCREAEVVYHVAGRIHARSDREFLAGNRDGTARLVEAAAAHPPGRFVYVSTLAVGGPTDLGRPIDEQRPPAPVSGYGRSKLEAEETVRHAPFPWTIVRPPVVYGEWDRQTLRLFRLAAAGWGTVIGEGTQELSVIYAPDLAGALIAAALTPAARNRVYYATHPTITTTRELVRLLGQAVGTHPRLLRVPGALARGGLWAVGSLANLLGRSTVLSADKANELLAAAWTCSGEALTRDTGWRATTDLETGLAQTAAWYRVEGWL